PNLPVLAIGAGYQHLAALYGHTETTSAKPVYGQPVAHHHCGAELFAGLPVDVKLISYHAWRLHRMDTDRFAIHATGADDAVLAFRVQGPNHWALPRRPAAQQSLVRHAVINNFFALPPPAPPPPEPISPTTPRRQRYEVFTRSIVGELDTSATFATLQEDTSAAFWLDSASAHRGQGDLTVMGTNN